MQTALLIKVKTMKIYKIILQKPGTPSPAPLSSTFKQIEGEKNKITVGLKREAERAGERERRNVG